jgi:RHS repeat-associated protein
MPTTVFDSNGNTTYSYDQNGNILTSTDASNNTWTYTYNAYNELLTSTPPSGSSTPETINTYDTDGNLETTYQHPSSGSNLTTTYNVCESSTCSVSGNTYKQGEVESTVDPRGYTTTFTYDTYGDQTSSADPLGDKTADAYTAIGQLYCSTSPNATHAGVACPTSPSTRVADTTSETFDSSDTVLATSTDPNNNTTTYTFDPDGNQTVVEDPLTNSTVTAYDADDRPTSVTSGSGSSAQTITTTAYDVAPGTTNCSSSVTNATSCTLVTQASGSSYPSVTSSYDDAFGNLIQTTDPGGEVTTDTYDQANNLATSTTAAGETTYTYQPNNWLSSETFSDTGSGFTAPSSSTSFTYYNDGVRHTMVDSTGTTTYTYDPYGRLQSVVDGAGNTVTYGYDQDGDTTCISYPNSGTNTCQNSGAGTTGIVTYGYDDADRMTSLEDWNSKTTTFGYDDDSNWNATSYPTTHATTVSETYGNADNLTNETVDNTYLSGNSQSTTWTPDADDLFASTQADTGTVEDYGYNSLNQVTSLAGSDSYTYDQLGRVTSDTPSGGSATNFGYNSDSSLCWSGTGTGGSCSGPPSGSTTYGTNAINERCYSNTSGTTGTCASPPSNTKTTTYAYNQLGELACSTAANSKKDTCATGDAKYSATYTYNGDGLRMSDTPANGSIQQFTWDVSTSVPQLLADGTNSYLYGPNGTPIEQIVTSTSVANYLVSDPTGVIYQFKAGGDKNGAYTYNPYGQCASGCNNINTPFGFEDGYTDASGLIYLVNRYYDPATDQFISVDPLVSATGQPFSYAGDDPVNGSDPLGLCGIISCITNAASWSSHQLGAFANGIGSAISGNGSSWCNDQEGPQRAFACSGGYALGIVAPFIAGLAAGAENTGTEEENAQAGIADASSCEAAFNDAPESVQSTLDYINENGRAPQGFKGGGVFQNIGSPLPTEDAAGNPISYQKWDVNPYTKGIDRGSDRLITGSNGTAYYTTNHYVSFIQIQ